MYAQAADRYTLQALVTMNDVQWMEAAASLAQRVIQEAGGLHQRINCMSELLLAHEPSPPMAAVLENSLHRCKSIMRRTQSRTLLVEIGEKKRDASIPEGELAAWTMVASEMLNLDETMNK